MNPAPPVPAKRSSSAGKNAARAAMVAVSGLLAVVSSRELAKARSLTPIPAEALVLSLEHRDGRLCRRISAIRFTGVMTEYHSPGVLKSRTSIVGGLLDGVSEGFFTNGAPQVVEHFKNGIADGPRATWRANGRKMSEGTMTAGKQEGVFRRWHENGRLAVEAEFADGKPHGLSRSWYPSGFLKAEASMNLGKLSERRVYEDGECEQPVLLARLNTP